LGKRESKAEKGNKGYGRATEEKDRCISAGRPGNAERIILAITPENVKERHMAIQEKCKGK